MSHNELVFHTLDKPLKAKVRMVLEWVRLLSVNGPGPLDTTKTVQKIKQYEEHNACSLRGYLLAQESKTTTCWTRLLTIFTSLLKQK